MDYEATIGLEIHVQLKTRTKMFTAAPYAYGAAPNTQTDPVVLGLPGTLPVLNHEAIEKCAQLGLMLGCEIAEVCKWDRKNYFYPDSPKNYQLTQNEHPLCLGGSVEIELADPARNASGEHRETKHIYASYVGQLPRTLPTSAGVARQYASCVSRLCVKSAELVSVTWCSNATSM